jgi:hypothetical protein
MLRFEEYVSRRKKEDRLNEFDLDNRAENMKICVNYVFEYFNNYLNVTAAEDKMVLHDEKIEKYRRQIQEYDPEVRDWLVEINSEYGHFINRTIGNELKRNEFFFLFNTDQEFRNLSYDCYSKLIKKYPYLKDQTEMLFLFIKNFHQISSGSNWQTDIPFISEDINNWIDDTWTKRQVKITSFAYNWVSYFYDHQEIWPSTHRKKSLEAWRKYEYDYRQSYNLFNLNSLYVRMPKKSFTRGRKQEFEILMMYFWIHEFDGDDGYWQEYLQRVIPAVNKVNTNSD